MDPTRILTKMFGTSARVLVKDGEFNHVEGVYERHDYSQHITNIDSNNMIGNTIHNVGNSSHQDIYYGQHTPSNHHNRRSATDEVVPGDASAVGQLFPVIVHPSEPQGPVFDNHALQTTESADHLVYGTNIPQPQALMQGRGNLIYSSSFVVNVKSLGQHVSTRPGDIRPMMAAERQFMDHQMAVMTQEMNAEFGVEDWNDPSEDEISGTRSSSLTTNFQSMTIDERGSPSAQSSSVYASSSYTPKAQENSRRVEGDFIEVIDSRHEYNFNSHRVANNIVEDSFCERE